VAQEGRVVTEWWRRKVEKFKKTFASKALAA
jgi:hypothetical protein